VHSIGAAVSSKQAHGDSVWRGNGIAAVGVAASMANENNQRHEIAASAIEAQQHGV